MLFAHWLYLIAALLKMIDPIKNESNVFLEATLHMEAEGLSTRVPSRKRRLSISESASILRSNPFSIAQKTVKLSHNDFEKGS